MSLSLFAHPFSSYCQKALVALYENATPFTFRMLEPTAPESFEELAALWPIKKFPLLVDDGKPIPEATMIIEHLEVHHPGPVTLIPKDAALAVEVRLLDRVFDNYVETPFQKIVGDALRPQQHRDPFGVEQARANLDVAYAWLDRRMADREWAVGEAFSLADCSAAPALFYGDWIHPFGDRFPNLTAYRRRLNARPSYARAIDEARPYRPLFPLGAPDQD
jgi:glutathione S-transferase